VRLRATPPAGREAGSRLPVCTVWRTRVASFLLRGIFLPHTKNLRYRPCARAHARGVWHASTRVSHTLAHARTSNDDNVNELRSAVDARSVAHTTVVTTLKHAPKPRAAR
jgi:hypothetical protein